MVCVWIDVVKNKHDCYILDLVGTTLIDCFTMLIRTVGIRRQATVQHKSKGLL